MNAERPTLEAVTQAVAAYRDALTELDSAMRRFSAGMAALKRPRDADAPATLEMAARALVDPARRADQCHAALRALQARARAANAEEEPT